MTTRQLIVKYRALKKTDPVAAYQLFLENEKNERFTSLVRICDNFIQFTEEFIEEGGDVLNRKLFGEYLGERFKN